ncbi:nicotinate-nucleotide--dimethylbenzimidazole phosphoribosyltransferase [Streptomyces sp. B93]|uniref:nicotinate-nucleotide--dimethylbenzimidazole phosphoribosyltransferase n=1 Tax=Streptomyces sp. B93 TaxID=2824875 RepID=UPI001B361AA2|nr:nicotinate-nucleotide--dimethylbenzimidazole phosphoribosyltransferase [Streptomyces sp. B93]MBQ1091189.1 nicotinate-nucleotide--dimethylbenzimidazole phosphoribosyltransferase [Streptomyces sp. B93]
MTDTGQVPGEGLPENAGTVEQPGASAHGAYAYLSESPAEDEDLLLPGAQGAWGNEVPPPAPEPVVEAVHQPGPHEMSGRDSGSVDLGGVRVHEVVPGGAEAVTPAPGPAPDAAGTAVPAEAVAGVAAAADVPGLVAEETPEVGAPVSLEVEGVPAAPVGPAAPMTPAVAEVPAGAGETAAAPAAAGEAPAEAPAAPVTAETPVGATPVAPLAQATAAAAAPRRPLHLGPPIPDASASPVRSLADRGPAGAPVRQPSGPQTGGPEYLDVPRLREMPPQGAAPWGAQVQAPVQPQVQVGAGATPAETVVPAVGAPEPVGAAQAAVTRLATEAAAAPAPQADAHVDAQAEVHADALADAQADLSAAPEPGTPDPAAEPAPVPAPEVPAAPEPAQLPDAAQPAATAPAAAQAQDPADGQEAEPTAPDTAQAPETAPVPEPVPAPHASLPDAVAAPADPSAEVPQATEPPAAEPSSAEPEQAAPSAPEPQAAAPAETPAAPPTDAPAMEDVPATHLPVADVPAAPVQPVPEPLSGPQIAPPAEQAQVLPTSLPEQQPAPDGTAEPAEHVGQFVPVDGSVPTTPHLAPTPPQPLVLPTREQQPESMATVPAPREADQPVAAEAAQSAEDLDTRAADQDEGTVEARRPVGPAAPPYDDAEREAVLKVMRERRDIRNGFRSDPIPHEVLLRVLEAAHTAPSVGHSQPWDFVVIRSADTRRAMHELAMRQREAYAKSLPKGRAKQFKELKIEAILDTPVNIVVTADPTRGGRHTLGRHTQPQMAPYSSALAVENLWLAARAEGLGVGWVSFFDEREMVRALGLPEHLEVVAYLCVGYVDEFPDEPELMQAGWSKRRPLSWVVHEETYGRRALPGEEPHDLLAETVAQIRPLDAKALGEAWERQKRMTKPAGALGMLEIISAQLSGLSRQCPPPIPEPAAVAIFAGDHGVHAQGVTPWPQEVTAQMVANFLGGGAVCNAFAGQVGAEVCIVDVGVASDLPATPGLLPRKVRPGTADMTTGPALTREEVKQAIEVGIDTARDLVAAGNKALLTGEMGIANTTASAALISVFTGADPAEVTGRGTGINDETLARKTEVVRRAIELHQPDPADPVGVLAAFGGLEHAAMVGLLLGGASLRTPVILDGVSAGAAALVARAIAPEVLAACIAGHRSAEPGHVAALNKLGLRPLVDLDLRLGEGTGALLALPLVQSTARAMHEVATFDSAGVTEK